MNLELAKPVVSVIIPSLDRPDLLAQTVDHFLTKESVKNLQLVVVDQSEPANEQLRERQHIDPRLNYHHVDFRGLPHARNFGVRHADAEIIVFSEDDVIPCSGYLQAFLDYFKQSSAVAATGPVVNLNEDIRRIDDVPTEERIRLQGGQSAAFNVDFSFDSRYATGGNAAFRKSAVLAVGGFDENFQGSAWGEDEEFSYRLRQNGRVIRYLPGAKVIHLKNATGGCRALVSVAYIRSFCMNAIYLRSRVASSRIRYLQEIWALLRRFVFNKRGFDRTLPQRAWAAACGILAGFRLAGQPPKLPMRDRL